VVESTWQCKVSEMLQELTNLPPLWQLAAGGLLALCWAYGCLFFTAHLKKDHRWRTGYTRKTFHTLIFVSAVVVHGLWGFVAVCVFGAMVTVVVANAVIGGPGNRLYEAIAREQDGKYRTRLVVIPYFATLIGGLTSSVLFGPLAVVGYLVGGLGDAAGEPIGTRWGKHSYQVSNAAHSTKTYEGSLGVVVASAVALSIAVAILPGFKLNLQTIIALPLIAVICGLVEAFSPRGWDNVPMQVVPTFLVAVLLSM
jgi:phytol kinase